MLKICPGLHSEFPQIRSIHRHFYPGAKAILSNETRVKPSLVWYQKGMTSVWSRAIAKLSHVRSVVEDTVLVLGGSEAGRGPMELEHSSPDGSGVCNGASELRKRSLQAQLE